MVQTFLSTLIIFLKNSYIPSVVYPKLLSNVRSDFIASISKLDKEHYEICFFEFILIKQKFQKNDIFFKENIKTVLISL